MPPDRDTRHRMRTGMSAWPRIASALAAVVFLTLALAPVRYAAVARVLLPPGRSDIGPFVVKAATFDMSVSGEPGSRVLAIEHWGVEPRAAADAVNAFVASRLEEGMTLIDEAPVPFTQVGPGTGLRLVYGFLAAALLAGCFVRTKKTFPSERSLIRHALRFVRNGEKAMLIDTGEEMRVVLSREAAQPAAPQLRILATFAGGRLVVARVERKSVAWPRRAASRSVANS